MNAAEAARKAATIMSGRGHAKGNLVDSRGRVCNNGAIMLAMGVPEDDLRTEFFLSGDLSCFEAIHDAEMMILASRGIRQQFMADYNDADSTSGEDVILLLKLAAERLEDAC
jgi:hypothetical protein